MAVAAHEPLSRFGNRYLDVPRLECRVGVPLADQPGLGHNRWHPDIPPAIEIGVGDEVILEAPGYDDYQVHDNGSMAELTTLDLSRIHPLAGPVHVDGVDEGDLLVVDILGVEPLSGIAFSNIMPGTPGILGQLFPDGYRSTWHARGGIAESPDLPGIRIPAQPHPGTIGVAPSHDLMAEWARRERPLFADGRAHAPEPRNAWLRGLDSAAARVAARTQPPRENGGNMDINKLGPGARVYFPTFVKGGRLSLGDHHLSAGDGECSWNAMEMDGRTWLRVGVIKDGMARYRVRTPLIKPASVAAVFVADRYLGFTGFCFDSRGDHQTDVKWGVFGTTLGTCSCTATGWPWCSGTRSARRPPMTSGRCRTKIGAEYNGMAGAAARPRQRAAAGHMVTDRPGHAKELLASKKVDNDEQTVIPTYGVAVHDRLFPHYMSVKHWGQPGHWTLNHSGLAYSDDQGRNWTKDSRRVWPGDSNFGQVAIVDLRNWLYFFGIPGGRYGGVALARVRPRPNLPRAVQDCPISCNSRSGAPDSRSSTDKGDPRAGDPGDHGRHAS